MTEIDKTIKPTKLLWVDLEMTGLDPDEHVIIEVAALVTDFDFKTLAKYDDLTPPRSQGRISSLLLNYFISSHALADVVSTI